LGVGTCVLLGCGRIGYDELNEFGATGSGFEAAAGDALDGGRTSPGDVLESGRTSPGDVLESGRTSPGDVLESGRTSPADVGDLGRDQGDAAVEAAAESKEAGPADVIVDGLCPNVTQCALRAALVHRYSFDGTGTVATDSVGAADGTVVGARLARTGSVVLAGGSTDQYVDLPNGIIHPLIDATIEVWLTWDGGTGWQRIFDFGSSNAPEGSRGGAVTTLFLTPEGGGPGGMIGAFAGVDAAQSETQVSSGVALKRGPWSRSPSSSTRAISR